MGTLQIGRVSPGDTLVCCKCEHEREVDRTWIDAVCERHFTSRYPSRLHDSDLCRFRCSKCGSKALVKRSPQSALPQPPATVPSILPVENSKYQFALAYVEQATFEERAALFKWAAELVSLRAQDMPVQDKAIRAVRVTIDSGAVLPFVTFVGAEIKRVGWDERGLPERLALSAAAAAALVFGGQGAGIAALGTAIGVPLWVVFGAGGALAGVLVEDARRRAGATSTKDRR